MRGAFSGSDANGLMTVNVKNIDSRMSHFQTISIVEEPLKEWFGATRSQTQAKDDDNTARESTNVATKTQA